MITTALLLLAATATTAGTPDSIEVLDSDVLLELPRAERIPLGIPRNYKPRVVRTSIGELLGAIHRRLLEGALGQEPQELARLREKAVRRQRRLIYNNDGGDIGHADTVEGIMALRNETVLGTQVDTIFYGTGATTAFTHLARVGEIYGEFGGPWGKNIATLRSTGHDVLATTIEFCRRNGLEVFWTHRMNDVHDSAPDAEWILSGWKRDNPRLLMGTREDRDNSGGIVSPRYWWSALDFEKPEVRDYLCRIQEDVCRRYDIDGIECDYFRNPLLFRPNLDKEPATPAQVEILTNFQRRLRMIHRREGTRRGRPILTTARVPPTVATCLYVGIDIRRWLEEGLVDLLSVSGGYLPHTEPVAEIIELAHRHGVPVFPSINTPIALRNSSAPHEALRGAAANLFHAGADGILLFNHFKPDFMYTKKVHMTDIGAPETLIGRNKRFVIENGRWTKGSYSHAIVQSQVLPLPIPGDGRPLIAWLPIGDDIAGASRKGELESADLHIRLGEPGAIDAVEVRLNGTILKPVERKETTGQLVFRPYARHYQTGSNQIELRARFPSKDAVELADLIAVEVPVIYR